MGKKDKAKMAKLRTKFIDGTVERGIPKSTAEALFDGIAKFAEYGFNRAHSAAYGLIAYQTAYLKANHPLEYVTALLVHMEGNAERVATAIVDCRLRGIDVLAPDINQSRVDFSMVEGRILFGLAAIKNVGRHAVESIVSLRDAGGPFKSLEDLCERTSAIQDVNRRVLEALVQSGACDSLGERARLMAALDHAVSRAERARTSRPGCWSSRTRSWWSRARWTREPGARVPAAPRHRRWIRSSRRRSKLRRSWRRWRGCGMTRSACLWPAGSSFTCASRRATPAWRSGWNPCWRAIPERMRWCCMWWSAAVRWW